MVCSIRVICLSFQAFGPDLVLMGDNKRSHSNHMFEAFSDIEGILIYQLEFQTATLQSMPETFWDGQEQLYTPLREHPGSENSDAEYVLPVAKISFLV